MTESTKTFGFRLPVDLAIEVKVATVRRQITLDRWFVEATALKLKTDQETQAA